ncbi:MAG TPA: ATP-binding protein [Puia sp.]|nr:ATP-binding protein [Puia sp.]
MFKPLACALIIFCLIIRTAHAADYTEQQAREAWAQWKTKPVTESSFRAVCDLIQDVGKNNIQLGYQILAEYLPIVKATGSKDRVHVLLMGWAKAKESLTAFDDAEKLYRQARENALGNPRYYDEALTGTVLLYADWGKMDSLDKYAQLGKQAATAAGDKENLSFIYTFSSLAHLTDTVALGSSLLEAIRLADSLPDKNALFTARYNYASIYLRNDPQQQAMVFSSLLDLAKDSTLSHKPRLYERTAFSFRNPASNIYLQLMQINLLLADYDNAWKFGEMLYDAVVRPNPNAPQAPFFNTELAMVRAYQGEYAAAKDYLRTSLRLFHTPEEKVPYPSYFLAAGMVAEHERRIPEAVHYYELAYKMGPMEGLHLMPSELYYAHGLILARRLDEAQRVLSTLEPALNVRKYTAYGFYYYKHYAELLKAKGDYPGYARALETFYAIKDSLVSFRHDRAIQEIEAKVRLRDKEQQITRLHEDNAEKQRNIRRDRIYFAIFAGLGIVIILLLTAYIRNRMRRMKEQHRIDVMQSALDAEENQRHKIADQLHDEVGGMLAIAALNVSGPTLEILSSVSTTIRELSHQLTPIAIEKYGFTHAVEDMAQSVNLSGRLQVQTVIVGFDDTEKYAPAFLKDCYRILQELLQNILKHAHATEALLEIVEHPAADGQRGQVSILAEDNGVGIGEDIAAGPVYREPFKGKGLSAIRSKIAYLDGRVEISRKQTGGTLVVIELPIKAN